MSQKVVQVTTCYDDISTYFLPPFFYIWRLIGWSWILYEEKEYYVGYSRISLSSPKVKQNWLKYINNLSHIIQWAFRTWSSILHCQLVFRQYGGYGVEFQQWIWIINPKQSNSKSVDGLDKMIGNRRIMNHITEKLIPLFSALSTPNHQYQIIK